MIDDDCDCFFCSTDSEKKIKLSVSFRIEIDIKQSFH